jgi:hypothetical protein
MKSSGGTFSATVGDTGLRIDRTLIDLDNDLQKKRKDSKRRAK